MVHEHINIILVFIEHMHTYMIYVHLSVVDDFRCLKLVVTYLVWGTHYFCFVWQSSYPELISHRWYSWTIHRSFKVIWIWRISSGGKLLISGWLCGQRKAVLGNHLSFVSIQDKISREFLSVAWKPWVCKH